MIPSRFAFWSCINLDKRCVNVTGTSLERQRAVNGTSLWIEPWLRPTTSAYTSTILYCIEQSFGLFYNGTSPNEQKNWHKQTRSIEAKIFSAASRCGQPYLLPANADFYILWVETTARADYLNKLLFTAGILNLPLPKGLLLFLLIPAVDWPFGVAPVWRLNRGL